MFSLNSFIVAAVLKGQHGC